MKRLTRRFLPFSLLIVFTLGSCLSGIAGGPDDQPSSRIVNTIPPATLTAISELAAASQTPVPDPLGIPWTDLEGLELEFWYIWDLDEPGEGMNAIVDRFNRENEWGITVNAVDQGLVLDPIAAVEAAFADGLVPHLMVSDSSAVASWFEEGLIIDLSSLIADPAAGLTGEEIRAFYPGIFENFRLSGQEQPGLPFTQSIQVIYYNQSWAKELGYNFPPADEKDFLEQSCALVGEEGRFGVLFSPQVDNILSFVYAYQGQILKAGGRGYDFTSPAIIQVAEDWRELYQADCGELIANYPNPMAIEMEFEHFNSRGALMIMGPALMMEHVHTGPNQTGRADQWKILPFFGPNGKKAVAAELQSGAVFQTSPEEELAAWLFLKYLVSPEVQAEWAQYSNYYPTRKDTLWLLREYRQENPHWAEGLNLLNYARPAPLDPTWDTVQMALEDAFEEVLAEPELDLEDQLDTLSQVAEELWKRRD